MAVLQGRERVRTGMLKLFTGPMYAGKSAHLIAAAQAHSPVLALKPAFDLRDGAELVSRDGSHFAGRSVDRWPEDAGAFGHIVLDEVQFMVAPHYAGDIVDELCTARARGVGIVVGGLDTDYRRRPFEIVSRLVAVADEVVHLNARCHVCGAPAGWTAKRRETGHVLETGDGTLYEARCDTHWSLPCEGAAPEL